MKNSTKFFLASTIINIFVSLFTTVTAFGAMRVVDIITFYATAFGAGASFAGMIVTLQREKKKSETEK